MARADTIHTLKEEQAIDTMFKACKINVASISFCSFGNYLTRSEVNDRKSGRVCKSQRQQKIICQHRIPVAKPNPLLPSVFKRGAAIDQQYYSSIFVLFFSFCARHALSSFVNKLFLTLFLYLLNSWPLSVVFVS